VEIVRVVKASIPPEIVAEAHHLAKDDLQDYCICLGSVAEEVVSIQVDVAGRIPVESTYVG
jgi:hypothetical protein